jgi:hypothetical protein
MTRLKLKAMIMLVFGLAIFFTAVATHAQSPQVNLQISPLPIQLTTKPGTSTAADLRIRNGGSQDVTLKASLKTFTAEGEDGHVALHEPTPADTYLSWVHLDKTTFNAPAGQWQTVHMSVDVPAGAAFGYYYAVQFELANPPKAKPGAANVRGAVAVFVLLNADSPGAKRAAHVASFKADHKSYEFLPVNLSVRVHNDGNVHIAPHGNIFIRRGSKPVGTLVVNNTSGFVLPGSNRIFSASWSDGFPVYQPVSDAAGQPLKDKNGQPKQQLKWDFSHANRLRFGHYTADLLLVYNDGQRDIPINGSVSFWVVPWKLILILLVIGVFVAIGIWSSLRRAGHFVNKARGSSDK